MKRNKRNVLFFSAREKLQLAMKFIILLLIAGFSTSYASDSGSQNTRLQTVNIVDGQEAFSRPENYAQQINCTINKKIKKYTYEKNILFTFHYDLGIRM